MIVDFVEICVANYIPPVNDASQGNYFLPKMCLQPKTPQFKEISTLKCTRRSVIMLIDHLFMCNFLYFCAVLIFFPVCDENV